MGKVFRCLIAGLCGALFLQGCASTPKTVAGKDGLTYTETIHNLRVRQDENFNLAEIQSISVAPTKSEVPPQTKKGEIEQFERMQRAITDQLVAAFSRKQIAAKVDHSASLPEAQFVLEPQIIEYYPGSAGLRVMVGFGAGFPSLSVRGVLKEAPSQRVVFRFETQREFELRPFEYGDEQILQSHVKDLAVDVADYLDRLKNGKLK